MTEMSALVFAFAAGLALGVFFALSLWRSARKVTGSTGAVRALAGGFVLRMAVILPVLFLVTDGRWERLLAAMLGFVLMKEIMVRRLGTRPGRA